MAHLTARQYECISLVSRGLHKGEIARQLGIRPKGVGSHLWQARKRLGARNVAEAVLIAAQLGEIEPPDASLLQPSEGPPERQAVSEWRGYLALFDVYVAASLAGDDEACQQLKQRMDQFKLDLLPDKPSVVASNRRECRRSLDTLFAVLALR